MDGRRAAMEFRSRVGDERFADLAFADLQVDPVGTLGTALEQIESASPTPPVTRSRGGPGRTSPGSHGQHTYELADFGLEAEHVRARFAPYMNSYDAAV